MYSRPPFQNTKKKQKKKKCINENHNRNSNSPIFLLVWISKKIPESQNIRLHTPSLFLLFFCPSSNIFAVHGDTAADRLFPTDILDSCFLENLPSPILLSEDRARVVDWHDTTRHEWRPWHSINRTKTNNVRHACELWSGEESSSPSPPTRCYSTAIMTRDQRALKLPLPSSPLLCSAM